MKSSSHPKAATETGPNALELLQRDRTSRRAFLTRMGAAGLGMAAISLLDGCSGGSSGGNGNGGGGGNGGAGRFPVSSIPGRTNTQKVLNYALTLELLEADLYRQALNIAAGVANPTTTALNPAGPGAYTQAVGNGALSGANAAAGFEYLRQFAYVEAAHAEFLTTALSGAPIVSRNPNGYKFPTTPASTVEGLLRAILPLEETGVRAYLGAGTYIGDLKTVQTAVSIYSTEARHSAAINYILGIDPGPSLMAGDQQVVPVDGTNVSNNTFEFFLTPTAVVAAIQPFLVP